MRANIPPRCLLMVIFRFEQRFLTLENEIHSNLELCVFMLAEQRDIFSTFSYRITKVAESRNRLIIEDSRHLSLDKIVNQTLDKILNKLLHVCEAYVSSVILV